MPTEPRFAALSQAELAGARAAVHVAILAPDDALALIIARADGLFGLPGGFVDPGESPRAAVARELHEELGITADAIDPAALTPIGIDRAWLAETGLATHLFALRCRASDMRSFAHRAIDAPHFLSEVMGVVLVHTDLRRYPVAAHLPARASLDNLLGNRFVANSRAQLVHALTWSGMLAPARA
ncbi:MAG: NUDIX hydrolase [Myxococcales bacterium]|nr:NUDIX hydrolase [Myxococcales bacterium]